MTERPVPQRSPRTRPDWRGWIALAWVFVWGWAYALMAIQARAPQVLAWYRSMKVGRSPLSALLGWLSGVFRS